MCQVFGVSKSGYYNWVQHEPSDRKQSDERLKLEIKVAHIRTRETYGTRRLQTELAENGITWYMTLNTMATSTDWHVFVRS